MVIIVSDENNDNADDPTPVEDYVRALTSLKPAAQVRVAAIVGSIDGSASSCSIGGGANCGKSVCDNPPPVGTPAYQWYNNVQCTWCSYYNVDDCCSALAGRDYVQFVRLMENAIVSADSSLSATNCQPPEGVRAACLIDTICQDNFGDTLARIARDLVLTDEYNLGEPAAYPPGVSVVVKNGRFGRRPETRVREAVHHQRGRHHSPDH